jgi:hypothetical protein
MASAVYAAKAALFTIVAAACGTVQCSYGAPGQYAEHETVWIDDPPPFGDLASIGQVSHRESFDIPVVVSVLSEGNDHQAADQRAWAIVGPIENAVRANPSLNNAVGVTGAYVTNKAANSYGDDAGRVVEIITTVTVRSKT